MPTFTAGLLLGFSLIIAIGAQNAFVLRQGLQRRHVFLVCLLCALSDALLIVVGVAGFGALTRQLPLLEPVARYGGAAFLAIYGALSIAAAVRKTRALKPANTTEQSAWRAAAVCLALTWLNPHVYLDTVLLLGSLSTQYAPKQHLFALGAATASFLFFFALGYGANLLRPLFAKPAAWRILDAIIGVIMLSIATGLVI